VIAHALHYSNRTGITHTESLSGHTVNECLTGRRAVKRHVADNDIFILFESCALRRIHNQFAAGQPFTEIVVGITHKLQCQPLGDKSAEALYTGTVTQNAVSILGERIAESSRNLGTENRTESTVGIRHIHLKASLLPCLERFCKLPQQYLLILRLL